ncbi:MAG: hypothetical protein ACI9GZ_001479 [Bacteroidia bacterium]|jgi:hypothetical protein
MMKIIPDSLYALENLKGLFHQPTLSNIGYEKMKLSIVIIIDMKDHNIKYLIEDQKNP